MREEPGMTLQSEGKRAAPKDGAKERFERVELGYCSRCGTLGTQRRTQAETDGEACPACERILAWMYGPEIRRLRRARGKTRRQGCNYPATNE